MSGILNTSEIVGTIELPEGEFEVCASADATFGPDSNSLVVRLDALLRPCSRGEKSPSIQPMWLPRPQTVTEHASIEEAGELARDIFHRWVRKLRESVPSLRAPTF